LDRGRYDALLAQDEPDDPAAHRIEKTMVTKSDSTAIDLHPGGGFIGRFAR
jgi:hypothetical protein